MPTPAHTKFVISGTMPGSEVFATSFCVTPAPTAIADLQAAVTDVANVFTTAGTPRTVFKAMINIMCHWTAVRGYTYAAGGTAAVLSAEAVFDEVGTGSGVLPNQVAIVASLRTGLPGRQRRGRMFYPATGLIPDSATGQLTVPGALGIAQATKALFTAANVVIGGPVIVSRTGAMATPVTQIQVDTRMDIIRARANKQEAIGMASQNWP